FFFFFFSSRRRHTRSKRDWSSDVCSSDDDRQVVDPVLVGQGGEDLCGRGGGLGGGGDGVPRDGPRLMAVRVVEDQHPGEPAAHLPGRRLVRMRVVPERGRRLIWSGRDR